MTPETITPEVVDRWLAAVKARLIAAIEQGKTPTVTMEGGARSVKFAAHKPSLLPLQDTVTISIPADRLAAEPTLLPHNNATMLIP